MIEKMTYRNHMNEEIVFGNGCFFVNKNDLHDFAWNAVNKNDKISSFKKGVVKKTIPIIIVGSSRNDLLSKLNMLFEVCEKDTLTMNYGKLIIGEQYLKCFVTASKKTQYQTGNYVKLSLTIQTDFPYWIKELSTVFGYKTENEGDNLDFNTDFPSDYTCSLLNMNLNNIGFVPVNFKMRIYGACISPEVTIKNQLYGVNVTVEENEYLTIDSVNKTVILTHADGTEENCFNLRNKDCYIFEKVPVGLNTVSRSSNFIFEIILFEERSEPKWI